MKNYKIIINLSLLSVVIGLYFFLTAITTKPVFNTIRFGHTSYSEFGEYFVSGSGIVSTNNKYKVRSATVRITIYDENEDVITSQFFDYSEHSLVEFNFKFTQNIPKRWTFDIYDAEINNLLDILFSIILISFGLGYGIKTYIKNKKYPEEVN